MPTVAWAHHMKGVVHPSPFGALSFPDSKEVPFSAWLTERIFQLSDGKTRVRTRDTSVTSLHHNRTSLNTRPERVSKTM